VKKRVPKPTSPRIRRSPEDAQALILDSAEALMAERGPDAVGLKAVAQRAQVSHALVTHYFGTYEDLVHRVLARRIDRARGQALEALTSSPIGPESTLKVLSSLVSDPLQVRLMTWAFLSSRSGSLFGFHKGDLKVVIDAIHARRLHELGPDTGDRALVEFLVTLSMTAGYGFALSRDALAQAMGTEPMSFDDFFTRLGNVIRKATFPPGSSAPPASAP
jgi:AcrR family transcriptional regulator